MRAILPLVLGVLPFGAVYGVAVAESSIDNALGGISSVVILAGASQLALLELLDQGAPGAVAVATALVINARFVLYSGALAPAFAEFPAPARYLLPHLMTDQAAATALLHFRSERDPGRRLRFYLGSAGIFAAAWVVGTFLGIAFSADIPASWDLAFAVPLMFLALLMPSVRDRPSLISVAVAAAVVVLLRGAPYNLGILAGATAGIAAGWVAQR